MVEAKIIHALRQIAGQADSENPADRQNALEAIMTLAKISLDENRPDEAVQWWFEAAKHNVPESFLNLVSFHTNRCANSSDIKEKKILCTFLDKFLESGKVAQRANIKDLAVYAAIAFHMTADDMVESKEPQAESDALYRKAADYYVLSIPLTEKVNPDIDVACLDKLALLYKDGKGVAQNYQAAYGIYREVAAKKGSPEALFNLADLHYNGWGCEKSVPTALKLLETAEMYPAPNPPVKKAIAQALAHIRQELGLNPSTNSNQPLRPNGQDLPLRGPANGD